MRCVVGTLSLVFLALAVVASSPTAVVNTVNGPVQGLLSERFPSVSTFKGIPYATPPLGNLRFAPARPVDINWTSPLNTSEFSAGCMNVCGLPRPSFTCTPVISEDCLYLNVYTPAPLPATTDALRPVLLFIHGGAFIAGAGGTPIYEASKLAYTQDMVVVTFNYRLGVFGAFYLDGENGAQGNQMLTDQQVAMKWVQANIAAFGGDPKRVTLGGESAGAISVGCHLVSPQSQGLFQSAYMSSNPYGLPMMDVKLVTSLGQKIVTNVGCDSSASAQEQLLCVQSVTAESLLEASNTTRNTPWPDQILASLLPWMPTVIPGSDILPVYPFQNAGTVAQVPVLMGTNANDSVPFVYDFSAKPLSQPEMDAITAYVFGILNAVDIRLQYGDCHCSDARYWFSDIATDYMFYCSSRNVSSRLSQLSSQPVYSYVFGHKPSFATWMWDAVDPLCDTKVCHADDVPFVFDNMQIPGHVVPQPDADEKVLIKWLQNAIGAFVRNNGTLPSSMGWTPYDPSTDSVMWLDVNAANPQPWMVSGHHAEFCALWDRIGYTSR